MAKKKLGEIAAHCVPEFAVAVSRIFSGDIGDRPWYRARLAVTQQEYDKMKTRVLKQDGVWNGRFRGIPLIVVDNIDDDFVPPELEIKSRPHTHIDHQYEKI